MLRKALFLDRDGTVCEEVGYLNHPDRLRLIAGAAQAVRRAGEAGFQVVLVTNQSGVARGILPEAMVHDVHDRLREALAEEGARLDGVYYCPHHPAAPIEAYRHDCTCRKPRPGMLLRAADEMGLDLHRSYLVGDSIRDIQAARAAGLAGAVLVRTGYGRGEVANRLHLLDAPPDRIAEDLAEAVAWILDQDPPTQGLP